MPKTLTKEQQKALQYLHNKGLSSAQIRDLDREVNAGPSPTAKSSSHSAAPARTRKTRNKSTVGEDMVRAASRRVSDFNKKGNPNYKSKSEDTKFAGTSVVRKIGDAFSPNNKKSIPQKLKNVDKSSGKKSESKTEKQEKAYRAVKRRLAARKRATS